MPNWCDCSVRIYGEKERIDDFYMRFSGRYALPRELTDVEGYELEHSDVENVIPVPRNLKNPATIYNWKIKNWGSRCVDISNVERGDNDVYISLASAWSPILEWCERIAKRFRLRVEIKYYEPGIGFAGIAVFNKGAVLKNICYDSYCNFEDYWKFVIDEDFEEIEWLAEVIYENLCTYGDVGEKDDLVEKLILLLRVVIGDIENKENIDLSEPVALLRDSYKLEEYGVKEALLLIDKYYVLLNSSKEEIKELAEAV